MRSSVYCWAGEKKAGFFPLKNAVDASRRLAYVGFGFIGIGSKARRAAARVI